MSLSKIQGKTADVHLWAPIHEVESQALDQLRMVASLPWVFSHVAAMPDVHLGKGCTVGSVVALKGALGPSMVGVDIGCGMSACLTNLKASDLPDSLKDIRLQIECDIPHGNAYGSGDFGEPQSKRWSVGLRSQVAELYSRFDALTPEVHDNKSKSLRQIGTLGGGNHFVELCLSTEQNVWMMLHSGSRNMGKTLAEKHIAVAKKLSHNGHLPDKDLSVFLAGTTEMKLYRHDLMWAQDYARLNRLAMLESYVSGLTRFFPKLQVLNTISCHHNYVAEEVHYGEQVFVTRKGAIRAGKGDMGIIPGSMGTRSYIVRGLGNPESFESASHGAGRRMSRGAAKKNITMVEFEAAMVGVEANVDLTVLDEAPQAYKNIEQVMENQKDLVEIVAELKQVLVVKG